MSTQQPLKLQLMLQRRVDCIHCNCQMQRLQAAHTCTICLQGEIANV